MDLATLSKMKFSPLMLDTVAHQMRTALQMAEGTPEYVNEAAENFRQAIRKWSEELKSAEVAK